MSRITISRYPALANFNWRTVLPAAVAALLIYPAAAMAAVFLAVVPPSAFDSNGSTENSIPFAATNRCEDGFRYQQLIDGDELGAGSIDSLAFRLDEGESSDFGPLTYGGMKVKLSSTTTTAGTLSDSFDANRGPDETLVFSGDLTMGATVSGSTPHPFDFEIPIEAPFEFQGGSRNLLVDISVDDCPPDAPGFFDADTSGLSRAFAWDKDSATAENVSGVGLVSQIQVSTPGLVAPLYDCPFRSDGTGVDLLRRGFYLENFPAKRLDRVTLEYLTRGGGTYSVRLTAREGSYDGRIIGGPRTVTFNAPGGESTTRRTFDFGGATVTEGATVTFTQEVVDQPAGGDIFYDTASDSGGCADITQTEGTSPPLDTHRRDNVGIKVDPVLRDRGLGGNWTVVGHNGEGFMLDVTQNNQLVAIWFTYDETGNQMWLLGVDSNFDSNEATMNLDRFSGPVFGPGFDPGDVMTNNWGNLSIRFHDCDSATVWYNSLTGFGSGVYEIEPIYDTEQGSCP